MSYFSYQFCITGATLYSTIIVAVDATTAIVVGYLGTIVVTIDKGGGCTTWR
jgi:hypothetical protein